MRKPPKYRRHKNGQAFIQTIRWNGNRPYYLGVYGTRKSKQRYAEILRQIEAQEVNSAAVSISALDGERTINALVDRYTDEIVGEVSAKEYSEVIYSLRQLVELFGETTTDQFKPSHLVAIQKRMVTLDWCRKTINKRVRRIKQAFRWGGKNDMAPAGLFWELKCVDGVTRGRWGARESPKVEPVERWVVEATLPWLSPMVVAMVRMHLICGMRSQDICNMQACYIDRSRSIWIYEPDKHKTAHLGKRRLIAIPRAGQAILAPYLEGLEPTEYVFSPVRSELARLGEQSAKRSDSRKTKIYPCELRARRQRDALRAARLKLQYRDHYDTTSYRQAVSRAIKKAGRHSVSIPHWHPHQLRHTISTEISQTLGEQKAQRWLGHERLETTGIYTQQQIIELEAIAETLDSIWGAVGQSPVVDQGVDQGTASDSAQPQRS